MRSGLFGRTPLPFQDGTIISPIRRCILNGICYGNGEAELLDSYKFCGSFRVKCASGHRNGTGGFSQFCGGFHVKYASVKRNILRRFHYGSVIFSNSPMHFEQNSLMGMEKRNCRILTVSRRIPCERCKWAAEYSGGLRLCGGSSKSHDLLCCICGKEGRL
ncbi:unnamed protein product [Sphagnum jensenii]